jgi:hypothetical protein
VWCDDCVELYVLPHSEVGYKQIGVNVLGTIFDQSHPPGGRSDRSWNGDVKAALSAQPGKGWKVALSVPLRDLGARTGGDQTWRFNVTRFRKARGGTRQQEYTWCELPTEDFQQPHAFGLVEHVDFLPQGQGEAAPPRVVREARGGLEWSRLAEPRGVRRCFPHPLDPLVAWCATDKGLLVTRDEGHTWTPAVGGSSPAVGGVSPRRETRDGTSRPQSRDGDIPPTTESGRGGILWAVAAEDGKKLSELKLASPPVHDGLIAAAGRLFLATLDGKLLCLRGVAR